MQPDPIHSIIRKLYSVLPVVREWIEKILQENKDQAVPVISLSFPRLEKVFPLDLLKKAKAVVVFGEVPFPPLSRMGLPEFSRMESMNKEGITYKDTFFISHFHQTETEGLYFHELVHVVQWERLGVDKFLLAYGVGMAVYRDSPKDSPLEKMAYSLQNAFDQGALPTNVIELIRRETDTIWSGVTSLISKV